MKTLDFNIDRKDLKTLYLCTGYSMSISFDHWVNECEASYELYFERQIQLNQNPKTFTQWVNGQIIALT